jgi:hypothetical protein
MRGAFGRALATGAVAPKIGKAIVAAARANEAHRIIVLPRFTKAIPWCCPDQRAHRALMQALPWQTARSMLMRARQFVLWVCLISMGALRPVVQFPLMLDRQLRRHSNERTRPQCGTPPRSGRSVTRAAPPGRAANANEAPKSLDSAECARASATIGFYSAHTRHPAPARRLRYEPLRASRDMHARVRKRWRRLEQRTPDPQSARKTRLESPDRPVPRRCFR